jgi:capsular polysaccharide biosynthesis protein
MIASIRKRLSAAKRVAAGNICALLAHTPCRRLMLTDIQEIVSIHPGHADIVDYRRILEPQSYSYEAPYERRFLAGSDNYRDFQYHSPERFVCTIEDGSIDMESGVVCTRDGLLLAESAMECHRLMASRTYRAFRRRRLRRLSGEYTTVWGLWGSQFYHWWIDCLPRVASLVSTGILPRTPLLMPTGLASFHLESLAACVPEGTQIVPIEQNEWLEIDRLVFPSFVTWKACGLLPSIHRDYLRERLFAFAGVLPGIQRAQTLHPNGTRKRLYLSRRGVGRRNVLNEPEVESFLSGFGFETCKPESLSLKEQIRLFRQAELIVAPHGSALVNLLFGDKLTLLELFPNRHPATHFFFLCQSLGHRYFYLLHDQARHHDDFTVDMRALRVELERAMTDV